jgi:hypothetical protein
MARIIDTTAASEPIEKLFRLPILLINIDAGIVVKAVETTISDSGKVASAWLVANCEPMMPPSITMTMVADVEIS